MRELAFAACLCLAVPLPCQSSKPPVAVSLQRPAAAAGRLLYDLVIDAPRDGGPAADSDRQRRETVARLRERLPGGATLEWTGGASFAVTPASCEPAAVARLRYRLETVGWLDMRLVASDDYAAAGCRFDLSAERERLNRWLDAGHRVEVITDPRAIRAFREHPADGPLAGKDLRWCVHRIGPDPLNADHWAGRLGDVASLRDSVVLVNPSEDWNGGSIPERLRKRPDETRCLVELVAVNCHERHFGGDEFDPKGFHLVRKRADEPVPEAVTYGIRPNLASEYADWTEKWIGHHLALILDDEVIQAPRVESRIPGRGAVTGSVASADIEDRIVVLQLPLPGPAPRFVALERAAK